MEANEKTIFGLVIQSSKCKAKSEKFDIFVPKTEI